MHLINEQNAAAYLREKNLLATSEEVRIRELPGGVSNVVLYVTRSPVTDSPASESPTGDFVVKQAREQLRVAAPWFCSVERIWREVETMQVCTKLLADTSTKPSISISTPTVLFSVSEDYLYGMSAVPDHETWKQRLLRGEIDHNVARACGWLMGRLHGASWQAVGGDGSMKSSILQDQQFFDDLRIDPYYREIARVHPDLAPAVGILIESLSNSRCCLVHGDFSPKNLLINARGLTLIDFEVGHVGDPAFDIGFFLSHLALKAFRAGHEAVLYLALIDVFRQAYVEEITRLVSARDLQAIEQRAGTNLAACMLARIDGKSQVDYLSKPKREQVRRFARSMLLDSTTSLDYVIGQLHSDLKENYEP